MRSCGSGAAIGYFAPIRTLRHALPTYLATLGARPGLVMAVSAQALRVCFVLFFTWVMIMVW